MSFDVHLPAMPSEGSSSSSLILETAARVLKSIHSFQDTQTDSSGTPLSLARQFLYFGFIRSGAKEGEDRRLEWGMSSSTVDKLTKARTVNETQSEKTKRPLSLGKAFIRHFETSICLNPNSLAGHITKGNCSPLLPRCPALRVQRSPHSRLPHIHAIQAAGLTNWWSPIQPRQQ